jgi:hypothetical protein
MLARKGRVEGAFTVQVIRADLGFFERRAHDKAWGLDFGDPNNVNIPSDGPDHPMALNMEESYAAQLATNASMRSWRDDRAFSLLHLHALAGNANLVAVLLDAGLDPNAVTSRGLTPLALARSLGWKAVEAVLVARGVAA